jgi:hypothetical protein
MRGNRAWVNYLFLIIWPIRGAGPGDLAERIPADWPVGASEGILGLVHQTQARRTNS